MSILESGELWESVFPPVVSFVEGKDKKTGGYRGRIEQGGGAAAARAAGGDVDAEREVAEKDEREVGLKIGGLVRLGWILRGESSLVAFSLFFSLNWNLTSLFCSTFYFLLLRIPLLNRCSLLVTRRPLGSSVKLPALVLPRFNSLDRTSSTSTPRTRSTCYPESRVGCSSGCCSSMAW